MSVYTNRKEMWEDLGCIWETELKGHDGEFGLDMGRRRSQR